MKKHQLFVFIGILAALLAAPSAFALQKDYVIISSGAIMPAGLLKKPSGFVNNLIGQKYILNDMQIEGISAFPPGKVFTLYQEYLKKVIDIGDIKTITTRIQDLYAQNNLPEPKIVLPLNRFTEQLAIIQVIEPRSLRHSNADPATLGEVMKKVKEGHEETLTPSHTAPTLTDPAADLSETEVSLPGIATSFSTVEEMKPQPIPAYEPVPIVVESFDVVGATTFSVLAFKSMGKLLVDRLFNIHDVLALSVTIKNLYIENGLQPPSISVPLDDLLNNRLIFQISEQAGGTQNMQAMALEPVDSFAISPVVSPDMSSPLPPKAAATTQPIPEPKKALPKAAPSQKSIKRIEIERGIFLIQQS